jgi:hypothetical protein
MTGSHDRETKKMTLTSQTIATALFAIVATATFLVPAAISAPGAVCGERRELVKSLRAQFNETQEDYVLASERKLIELFVSPQGTWTVLVTTPLGISCVTASGNGLPERVPV